jgi:hypothetical protein
MIIQHQGNNELPAGEVDVNLYQGDDLIFLKDYMQTRFMNYDDKAFTMGLSVEAVRNGRQSSTNTDLNYHIESGSYFSVATVASKSISGSGATATCTITINQTAVNGVYLCPGEKNQLVFLADGVTQAFVREKTASTSSPTATLLLASGVDETIDWATAITAGDQLGFYSQISSPGNTEFLTGQTFNDTRYLTEIMEVQTSTPVITSYMANSRFQIPEQGVLNGSKPYAIDRIMAELLPIHEIRKSFHMVWGTGKSYIDADGNTIKTSQGFYSLANTFGQNFDIAPQSMVLADWDNVCASLIARQGGPEVLVWCGHRLDNAIDKMIRPTMVNGGVVYSYFNSEGNTLSEDEGRSRAIDYGYGSFRYNNFSFHKKQLTEANHPFVTDIANDPLGVKANSGVLIPVSGGMSSDASGQNVFVPSWEVLYKPGRTEVDGSMQRLRVYDKLPVNFSKERFQRAMYENYALRAFRALKFTSITGVAG